MIDPDAGRNIDELNVVYDDLVNERDRLRDARRSVTARLGPLPAASAIVVGLFGAISKNIDERWTVVLYGLAVLLFAVIGVASWWSLRRLPYRDLRTKFLDDNNLSLDTKTGKEWLATMIEVERGVYPCLAREFGKERRAMLLIQASLLGQVLLLGWISVFGSTSPSPTELH